ncbi:hypothetical protein GGI22_004368 [Coemansia erecta]|nr:hypothetical protein GGI22_004368 [Coemansia erecta]
MSCNIFDVVLHPSLFQQQHEVRRRSQSAPISASTSAVSTAYVPSPPNNAQTTSTPPSLSQWGDDEWSEVRKRLWNAKCPAV